MYVLYVLLKVVSTSAVAELLIVTVDRKVSAALGGDHVGKPDPALVKTCPLVPAAPASVNAVVKFNDAIVGPVAKTFEPVPVFVTLTSALDASVATALEAVKLE
jgi:hypothetical protein